MSDFIDEIIAREGNDKETNDPSDSGGRTKYGISEAGHPEAWADGDVTRDEARSIYKQVYIIAEHFDKIDNVTLMHQAVDHGVMSGADSSSKLLQQLVGTTVDGDLGPKSLDAINNYTAGTLFGFPVPGYVLLNVAFRDARMLHYAVTCKQNPKNLKYILGWLTRAMEFV